MIVSDAGRFHFLGFSILSGVASCDERIRGIEVNILKEKNILQNEAVYRSYGIL